MREKREEKMCYEKERESLTFSQNTKSAQANEKERSHSKNGEMHSISRRLLTVIVTLFDSNDSCFG